MPTRFFPLTKFDDVLERTALVMSEFNVLLPQTTSVRDFYWHSDKAAWRREERRKAAEKGMIFIG